MMRSAWGILAALWWCALAPAAGATRIADSLTALRAQQDPGDHFTFVVMSDLHSAGDEPTTAALRETMAEVAALRPAFIVSCGDNVHGNLLEQMDVEWAQSATDTAIAGVPFFPAPGNHDAVSPEAEAAWSVANGPLRYSFDFGNTHFIVLNSIEQGGVWGEPELNWLKADLAAAKAQNILVFLHFPSWREDARWSRVHEVLRQYPVRVVFAGHVHRYRKFLPMDGIQYVTLPSPSTTYSPPLSTEDFAAGDFRGYLLVQVNGANVSWAVIRTGAIFPPDVVQERKVAEADVVARRSFSVSPITFAYGAPIDADVQVAIRGSGVAVASTLTWEVPPGWEITPPACDYSVPAGGRTRLTFHVRANADAAIAKARPTFSTQYRSDSVAPATTVKLPLSIHPSLSVKPAASPIAIDGALDEWAGVRSLPLRFATRFSASDRRNLEASVQVQWDARYLYLAVTVHDNTHYQPLTANGMWLGDSLQFHLDPANDGADRDHDADDHEYGVALDKRGAEVWVYRSPAGDGGEARDIKRAVVRRGELTTYEVAVPAARLAPARLAAGGRVGFNVAVHDKDGPESGRTQWWLDLLPGAGGGGDSPMLVLDLVN